MTNLEIVNITNCLGARPLLCRMCLWTCVCAHMYSARARIQGLAHAKLVLYDWATGPTIKETLKLCMCTCVWYLYVFMQALACVACSTQAHECTWVWRPKADLSYLLQGLSTVFLRQALSLNIKLIHLVRLARNELKGSIQLWPLSPALELRIHTAVPKFSCRWWRTKFETLCLWSWHFAAELCHQPPQEETSEEKRQDLSPT